jgi:hypothetical protein
MANGKSDEFELDDSFEESASSDFDSEDVAKTNASSVKLSLTKRRVIDELLEERRLQKKLRDYDYDLDDDK